MGAPQARREPPALPRGIWTGIGHFSLPQIAQEEPLRPRSAHALHPQEAGAQPGPGPVH